MTAGRSQRAALEVIGLSKSSFHYRSKPRAPVAVPVLHRDRHQPAALSQHERDQICQLLAQGAREGLSVEQIHLRHLDSGPVLASSATFHRLASQMGSPVLARPVRARRARTSTVPQLMATGPDQVYCWDITFLPGLMRGERYALYSVIDLYSRKIVGHTVQSSENHLIAARLLTGVIEAAGGTARVVHSDNGAAMTSASVAKTLADHGVERSLIRPGVSNDNAYIESWFGTVKGSQHYPGVFQDINHAQTWVTDWVCWYNNEHRHSALTGYTPASMHDGSWTQQAAARQQAMHAHYRAHPRRYRQEPTVLTPPARATINLANDGSRLKLPPTIHTLISH